MRSWRKFFLWLKAMARLVRYPNLAMMVLVQYTVAFCFFDKDIFYDINLVLLSGATVLIAMGGYIINDYFDVKIDAINKQKKNSIGKEISRSYALVLYVIFSFFGMLAGWLAGWKIGVICSLSFLLLGLYSRFLKRQSGIGNLTIAYLAGVSVYMVAIGYEVVSLPTLIYAFFAFMMTLIRELIKDVQDMRGDVQYGCKTIPILLGIRATKWILYILLGLLIIFFTIAYQKYSFIASRYAFGVLIMSLIYLFFRILRATTKHEFVRLSFVCKIIMGVGIVSMPLG